MRASDAFADLTDVHHHPFQSDSSTIRRLHFGQ